MPILIGVADAAKAPDVTTATAATSAPRTPAAIARRGRLSLPLLRSTTLLLSFDAFVGAVEPPRASSSLAGRPRARHNRRPPHSGPPGPVPDPEQAARGD